MSCHIFLTWPEKYRDKWELPSCANVCLFGTGAGAKLRSRCHVPWMPWMLQEGSGPGGYPARHGATPKWMVYVMEHPKVDIVNMDEKNRASPVASFIDIYIYMWLDILHVFFVSPIWFLPWQIPKVPAHGTHVMKVMNVLSIPKIGVQQCSWDTSCIWGLSINGEVALDQSSISIDGIFHDTNHPALGVPPFLDFFI